MRRGETAKLALFIAIFFVSGLAGLAYQVIWTKSFAAAVGHEYPALLAVVTAFMCGMAAGNVMLARARGINPRCYGWLEIGIGSWAFVIPWLTPAAETIVIELLGLAPAPLWHWTVVFAVAFLFLLPATAAMGATLPAAERFLASVTERPTTALLYGANTAGATLGTLLAAFWFMPLFGLRSSSFLLAALNLGCGVAALVLAGKRAGVSVISSTHQTPPVMLLQLFCAGLLGLGFEVAIVRGLSQILENTVYTFAVVLATYLSGTAVGALIYFRFPSARAFRSPDLLFAGVAFASLAAAILLRWVPTIYPALRLWWGDSLAAVAAAETLVAFGLLFFPCLLMGAIWSALAQRSLNFKPNLAWAVAVNTLGAALGPIVWGLILIPLSGLKGALAAVPLGYGLLAGRSRLGLVAVIIASCGIPMITSNRQLIDTSGGRIISLAEGVMGSVAVIESTDSSRVLKFNNRFQMGGTAARIAEQRQADIPLLLHPAPRRALFIGLGTGITFNTSIHYPGLIAEGVELVPEIARVMPLFNRAMPESSKLITHIADGRRFVRATTNRYDVIVSDLFHPAQDGAGFLYTREHFQAIRDRLAEGGHFCQWLPLYQMDLETVQIIARTFETVFPNAQCWLLRFNVDTPVVGLIGPAGPWHPRLEARIREHPALAEHLRSVGLSDLIRLFGCYLGESRFPASGELNTDADPVVIFRAPAITFRHTDFAGERLLSFIAASQAGIERPPWASPNHAWTDLAEANLQEEIPKFIRARDVYLKGLVQEARGDHDAALAAFIESARISSHFTAGYAQALALATGLAASDPKAARAILQALITAQPERPVARELLQRLEERN